MTDRTLELAAGPGMLGVGQEHADLISAIDQAAETGQVTRLLSRGRELARIVPPGTASNPERFWRGALARVRKGETVWFTGMHGGQAFAGLAPVSRIQPGAPDSFRAVPGGDAPAPGANPAGYDELTAMADRLAELIWGMAQAGPPGLAEVVPGVIAGGPPAISRWLRHGE